MSDVSTPVGLTVVLALVLGLVWALATPAILRQLPEPDAEADDEHEGPSTPVPDDDPDKIPYAHLATRPFAVTVGVLTAVATALTTAALPVAALPPWLVLATLGVLLAAIDARTTWLPLPLTRVAWLALAVAIAAGGLLGGWPLVLRCVVGFGLTGLIFGTIWLLTRGGFGFGDVRYAPLVGAATAGVGWNLLASGLVLGSLVGAVVGLVRLARHQRGAFAYAPSLLAGGYLAIALAWLTT